MWYLLYAGVNPRQPTPKQSTRPPRGRVDPYRILYGYIPRTIHFGSVLALSPTTCDTTDAHIHQPPEADHMIGGPQRAAMQVRSTEVSDSACINSAT
uniref:Uncharacterized protein n=1 Tax=Caenorhabditis japonica TaxID=281687 RepID=A0A8R1DTJ7_CAEJA